MKKQSIKNSYKWIIAILMFILIFVGLGFCSSNKSLYLAPITEALGFKRSAFSLGDSLRYVSTVIMNCFFGVLLMKFGMKKLISAGILCLIGSVLIYATADKLIWFYIAGVLLGVGFSWTNTTMVGCVINRWFTKNKGTVTGTVLSANGIGSAFAAQLFTPYIYREGDPFSYRFTFFVTAIILAVLLVLILIFFKDKALSIHNSDEKNPRNNEWEGIEFRKAIKMKYFYITAFCIFSSGLILQGTEGIVAAYLKDEGFAAAFVATVISVRSIALSATKFMSGFLYDRLGMRTSALLCHTCAVLSMVLMVIITNSGAGTVLAVVFGVIFAMALPLDTVMIPIFTNDLFGQKSYETILPILVSANTAGCAIGVPLWNLVFDTLGSYKPAAAVFGIILVIVLILFQMIITQSKKLKENTELNPQ